MKILHVLDHSIPLHSGYTFRTCAILHEQRRRGWQTAQLTSPKQRGAIAPEEDADGLHFYRTAATENLLARVPVGRELQLIRDLSTRLSQVIEREAPDIVHAHSPALNGVAAINVARKHGLPVVYEVRAFWEDAAVDHGTSREWGLRYRATRALESWVLHRADAVTTICDGLRREMIGRGLPAAKITIIPNAVDAEKFSYRRSPDPGLVDRLHLTGCRVIGFIGSFYAYEGLSLLLEAFAEVAGRHHDLRLLLVGGGPQDRKLRAQARTSGAADRILFTGRVPHADVSGYYDLVDIFAYPRLPMRLTDLVTPLKPLEAMAQGRIVIASDVGGHRELIRDRQTGFLFKAGDVAALAGTLADVLASPDGWPRVQEAGRRFVEAERTWAESVGRYEPVYERLL